MTTFWPNIHGWISIYTKTWSRFDDSKESDRPAWPRKSFCWPQKAVACLFWSEEKNVSCQWSTKHDLAVVQQNGREGKTVISLYKCLCSSCHDNLFTMPYVHFMAFYFQTFIPIDNDIWFFFAISLTRVFKKVSYNYLICCSLSIIQFTWWHLNWKEICYFFVFSFTDH